MSNPSSDGLTRLLREAGEGGHSRAELIDLVYTELQRLAKRQMGRERPDHTLDPTGLVHEAWMRLFGEHEASFENRREFFSAAAEVMRRVLVDHARARMARKRGGDARRVSLTEVQDSVGLAAEEILAVEEALARLKERHPEVARIVELRFFAGLSLGEIASLTGDSPRTLKRRWRFARAVLLQELGDTENSEA